MSFTEQGFQKLFMARKAYQIVKKKKQDLGKVCNNKRPCNEALRRRKAVKTNSLGRRNKTEKFLIFKFIRSKALRSIHKSA